MSEAEADKSAEERRMGRAVSDMIGLAQGAQDAVESLLAALPDAVVVVGPDGHVRYANPAALDLFGQIPAGLVGHPFRYPTTVGAPLAIKVPTPSGLRFGEMRVVRYHWYGETCFLASIRDLTDQRLAEEALQKAEAQIRQKQRLEAVGSLAGGVAHDFNNMLSVVLSYANLALETLPADDPLKQDMLEIRKASERASELTRQLLAFSRRQIMVPRVLDLNEVVHGMEKILARMLGGQDGVATRAGARVELSVMLSSELGKVVADPGQVEQILLNLVVNARDAMPEGGRVTIETANAELDEAYAAQHEDVTAGPYVVISVLDTGAGMDAETSSRVFEPFFTTKPQGKGTGLGLSVVYGIVRQMGGHVRLYSKPGTGTMFRVHFPRTETEDDVRPSQSMTAALRGTETVLLVEDDDQVRALARTVLRRNGYRVLEAQNAGEALLLSDKFEGEIHLLLTDVVMPRVDGRELAVRLAKARPSMTILLFSGYSDEPSSRDAPLPAHGFLQKPISPETLLAKVRELLDARAAC
jgi:signal transduction histidine kinase/ActR/RegA family two-component response regulator